MATLKSPEELFGYKNVGRKLVINCHELLTVRLLNPVNLSAFALRVEEAEYDTEDKFLKIRTNWGTIMLTRSNFQIQACRDPSKLALLASFVYQALMTEGPCSFEAFLRSLGPEDLGVIPDFVDDLRQVKYDLLKPLKGRGR